MVKAAKGIVSSMTTVTSASILATSLVVALLSVPTLAGNVHDVKSNLRSMGLLEVLAPSTDIARKLSWNEECYDTLKTRTSCNNLDSVLEDIGFTSYETETPYPEDPGYVTVIDETMNCYVEFTNPEARVSSSSATIEYNLLSLTPEDAAARNTSGTVYMTHITPCGACSTLEDLSLYLYETDLTTPVRKCAMLNLLTFLAPEKIKALVLNCLEDVGFTQPACKYIWYYNTVSTSKECGGVCALYASAPSNDPVKNIWDVNFCQPYKKYSAPLGCKNKIQRAPNTTPDNACKDFQWENGEYRLNSCLQCDECRSGPIFQKFAGRTRRGSGIESAILRPDEVEIDHSYGMECAST